MGEEGVGCQHTIAGKIPEIESGRRHLSHGGWECVERPSRTGTSGSRTTSGQGRFNSRKTALDWSEVLGKAGGVSDSCSALPEATGRDGAILG